MTIIISLGAGYGGGYIQSLRQKSATPASTTNTVPAPTIAQQPLAPRWISGKVLDIQKGSMVVEDIGHISPSDTPNTTKKITVTLNTATIFFETYNLVDKKTPIKPPVPSSMEKIKTGYYVQIQTYAPKSASSIVATRITYSELDPLSSGLKK